MSMRIKVNSKIYLWAWNMCKKDKQKLLKKFPKFPDWITGKKQPTFKQLESFASFTETPFSVYFFSELPYEYMDFPLNLK